MLVCGVNQQKHTLALARGEFLLIRGAERLRVISAQAKAPHRSSYLIAQDDIWLLHCLLASVCFMFSQHHRGYIFSIIFLYELFSEVCCASIDQGDGCFLGLFYGFRIQCGLEVNALYQTPGSRVVTPAVICRLVRPVIYYSKCCSGVRAQVFLRGTRVAS